MTKQRTENFEVSETIPYDAVRVDTCHCTVVKNYGMTPPRVNPNVSYALGVIMTCQCRFTSCHKCITLVPGVESGGGDVCVRQKVYGKSLH